MPKPTSARLNNKLISTRVNRLRKLGAPVSASDGYDLRKSADWTPQRLAALTRYENQFFDFIESFPPTGAVRVYPRTKAMKAAISNTFYRENTKPKWMKGEYIPNYGYKKLRISLDADGNLIIRDENRNTINVTLDPIKMATNKKPYLKAVYNYMSGRGVRIFMLKAANHYFRPSNYNGGMFTTEKEFQELTGHLMSKYGNTQDWMHYIEGHVPDDDTEDLADSASFVRAMINEHNRDRDAEKRKKKAEIKRIQREIARQRKMKGRIAK